MAEIYLNSNSPIKTKVFWKDELVMPDTVYASVYDVPTDPSTIGIDPSIPILELEADRIETDFGSYQIVLPYNYSAINRKLKIVWEYEVDGENGTHKTYVDVVTPYVSLIEAIEDLNLGSDPSDPNYKTYHDLRMAEKYARKTIENYCGQVFSLYASEHTVYGSGSDVLPLPFKLNNLYQLYSNDILLLDLTTDPIVNNWNYNSQISESGFGLRVNRASQLDNVVYTANGMIPPSINDSGNGAFIKDYAYRVIGKYGWSSVPDEVETACIELMKDYFSKDNVWRSKYVHSVQSFDWHFEYNAEAYRGTGNAYADQLLLPYVLTQLMVI
jgi:hypothetical protein